MQLKKNEITIENEEFNYQISNSKILLSDERYDFLLTNEGTVMGFFEIGIGKNIIEKDKLGRRSPFPLFLDNKGYLWYLNTNCLKKGRYFVPSIKLVNAPYLFKSIDKEFVIGVDNVMWKLSFDGFGIPSFFPSYPLKVKQVSCSIHFFFLICEDNSLWSHGHNDEGQLGLEI